jgi:hypothetical protein
LIFCLVFYVKQGHDSVVTSTWFVLQGLTSLVLHCLFSTPQALTGAHSTNDNLTFDWQNYEVRRPDITGNKCLFFNSDVHWGISRTWVPSIRQAAASMFCGDAK